MWHIIYVCVILMLQSKQKKLITKVIYTVTSHALLLDASLVAPMYTSEDPVPLALPTRVYNYQRRP